jgi:hypothetical protein
MSNRAYIGDAVYVELDVASAVILTTENGIEATNTIVLEPEVLARLLVWLANAGLAP